MDRFATWERRWADPDYDWVDGYTDDESWVDEDEIRSDVRSYLYNGGLIEDYCNDASDEEIERVDNEWDGSIASLKKFMNMDEAVDRIVFYMGKEYTDIIASEVESEWR